jgi:hypothetical protein
MKSSQLDVTGESDVSGKLHISYVHP